MIIDDKHEVAAPLIELICDSVGAAAGAEESGGGSGEVDLVER